MASELLVRALSSRSPRRHSLTPPPVLPPPLQPLPFLLPLSSVFLRPPQLFPLAGFGKEKDGEAHRETVDAVRLAIKSGFRHLDGTPRLLPVSCRDALLR